ncbi:glycosyltransferase family 2 protein [Salinivibrio kushneri]|uniref:glycosyltransferase family 2 protein n=1 Tax=Salinivibrio kushneri TaxID=1908198 RepID=UPI0009C8F4AE|nr:glycosyltransferase [Salinivibrio kushneri]OOE62349.1 hypothetical protein BZG18_05245 [Salinivibrio kushneri]
MKKTNIQDEKLRCEEEILKFWTEGSSIPIVSVGCIAYNHEDYIEDAIRGFLIQKTVFPFEILIHDDASTDKTIDIIDFYKGKYPNIIKVISQSENQYSKGKRITPIIAKQAVGKYITLCEGDDYWNEPNKLQRQYEALEKNENIDICFTSGISIDEASSKIKSICDYGCNEKVLSLSEIVRGGGDFMPTASLMIRTDFFYHLPNWLDKAPVGDYYFQILASKKGGAMYLPIKSCVYRKNSVGSWTSRRKGKDSNALKNELLKHFSCFDKLANSSVVSRCDVNYVKAKLLLELALNCYLNKDLDQARISIRESWCFYKFLSKRQAILYCLSFSPRITLATLLIYKRASAVLSVGERNDY